VCQLEFRFIFEHVLESALSLCLSYNPQLNNSHASAKIDAGTFQNNDEAGKLKNRAYENGRRKDFF
jgi:hypothetical protein